MKAWPFENNLSLECVVLIWTNRKKHDNETSNRKNIGIHTCHSNINKAWASL